MSEASPSLDALGATLRAAVADIARLVAEKGGRAMLVGGAVRDLVAGASEVKDADMEVFGIGPEALKAALARRYSFDQCGVAFGVLKLHHLPIDVSLPRRESKRGLGHKGFLVESDPSLSISEAASRRDFTVNAIYLDVLTGCVEDPFGGVQDLRRRILRHVSGKFVEDPLRVLRGMQFVARFDLSPAPETIALCRTMGMEGLARERVFDEWAKLLARGRSISRGLAFLRDTQWTRHFPELHRLIGCKQDPAWHPEGDAWDHTCLALDAFARRRTGDEAEDVLVGLAVLCHDFGKPATTRFDPATGHIRSIGHDVAGIAPTLSFLRRLTNEERILRGVPPLVKAHMQPFAMWKSRAGDAAIRRLSVRVGRIDRLLRVAQADDEGRLPSPGVAPGEAEEIRWLAAAAERLRIADSAPAPILKGRHLVDMGFAPSRDFGRWLRASYEAQLDGAFGNLAGAIAHFKKEILQ